VRDGDQQQRLVSLARDEVAASPLGSTDGFESVWNHVAEKLLTSYSDESYVSEAYGRELSGASAQGVAVEQVNDDPPDRISVWLATIAPTALRTLDLTLVLDLLRIEQDETKWGDLMKPVVLLLEDLLMVGDFDASIEVIGVLVREAGGTGSTARRQHAIIAIDILIAGAMMRHITTHLATIEEAQFERVKVMCVSLGEVLVRPLAEALSVEERPRTRERLTSILLAFGSVGRRTIERLKGSQNPAVRRTAIHLMRQFGGSEALPDLASSSTTTSPRCSARRCGRSSTSAPTRPTGSWSRRCRAARRIHARPSCSRSAWYGTSARRRCSPTFSGTSIIVARSRRSTFGRSNRSARCGSGRHRAAPRRVVQGRMVGAAAHLAAARRRRGGARAHRHA